MNFSQLCNATDTLWLQPRMGVPLINDMRLGIERVKALPFSTVGTITIDSFTRVNQVDEARKALMRGDFLNGFPLLCYEEENIQEKILPLANPSFPIQVRHGTPKPQALFKQMCKCGLTLTEGGPISYCLPYSAATSLSDATHAWEEACYILNEKSDAHLESFGGCLMGQMCHPSLLVAVSVLEALFFQSCGITSLSMSYAQQYSLAQDIAALKAMGRLAKELLDPMLSWHLVVYTFMGLFPLTTKGHERILRDSVIAARLGGAKRLIVKTNQEAFGLPSIDANIDALRLSHTFSTGNIPLIKEDPAEEEKIYFQAKELIDATLSLHGSLGQAIIAAFKKGILDIPFCMHPDNHRKTFCEVDTRGYLQWSKIGKMPINPCKKNINSANINRISSKSFLEMLSFNRRKYDSL